MMAISYSSYVNQSDTNLHAIESFNYFVLHQRTPLYLAAEKGRFENVLGYLLGKAADINIKDKMGVTHMSLYYW